MWRNLQKPSFLFPSPILGLIIMQCYFRIKEWSANRLVNTIAPSFSDYSCSKTTVNGGCCFPKHGKQQFFQCVLNLLDKITKIAFSRSGGGWYSSFFCKCSLSDYHRQAWQTRPQLNIYHWSNSPAAGLELWFSFSPHRSWVCVSRLIPEAIIDENETTMSFSNYCT